MRWVLIAVIAASAICGAFGFCATRNARSADEGIIAAPFYLLALLLIMVAVILAVGNAVVQAL